MLKDRHFILHLTLLIIVSFTFGCSSVLNNYDNGLRLVHDSKTGEYIGVYAGKCKMWNAEQAKYIVTYKVTLQNGSIVDYPQEKVKLNEP